MRRRRTLARQLVRRLREPSSLAGLASLCILLGLSVDQAQHAGAVAGAVLGALAVLVPERGEDDGQ